MGNATFEMLLSLCFIVLAGSHKSQKQLEHERLQREAKQEATMKNFRDGVTEKFESSKHQMRWTLRDYLDEPSCRSTCTALYRKCGVVKSSDGDRNSVLLGCISRSGMFADTHTAKTTHHQVRTKAKTKSKWSRHDVNKEPSCKETCEAKKPEKRCVRIRHHPRVYGCGSAVGKRRKKIHKRGRAKTKRRRVTIPVRTTTPAPTTLKALEQNDNKRQMTTTMTTTTTANAYDDYGDYDDSQTDPVRAPSPEEEPLIAESAMALPRETVTNQASQSVVETTFVPPDEPQDYTENDNFGDEDDYDDEDDYGDF